MLETGDIGGDKLSGLPCYVGEPRQADVLCGTSSEYSQRWNSQKRNSEHIKRLEPVFGGIWRPGSTFDAGHKKRTFRKFAVFSAFCSKNGAVTKR